jgi:preprotein translocase subunit SecG
MEKIILIVHLLTALAIIGMILLQQGKGAEAGASFGSGASQTVLGSAGGWNFFSKVTGILAAVFFVTSFGLAVIAKDRAKMGDGVLPELKVIEQRSLESELPDVDTDGDSTSDVPVLNGDAVVPEEDAVDSIPAPVPVE